MIDHPASSHDDTVNAVAGVLVIRDYIALLRTYRIDTIMSDDYGGGHYADECGVVV